MVTTEVAKYETVADIVSRYQSAQTLLAEGYAKLDEAMKNIGGVTSYFSSLPRKSYHDEKPSDNLPGILASMKSKTWQTILERTSAPTFMTPKRLESFRKDLEQPEKLPDITPDNIRYFVQNIVESAPDLLMEFIKETFDWLQPHGWSADKYKTNEKARYELQEKVIKCYAIENRWGGGYDIRYHSDQNIQSMDNAFHLLDGKGTSKYPGNAVTKIREAGQQKQGGCKTDYFEFKFFKNGNLHIKFLRMDLVKKINRIAGEGRIKP